MDDPVYGSEAPGVAPPREEDIVKALGQRLAKFKLPKRVFVVNDLPRNAMGKVQKVELRNRYVLGFVPQNRVRDGRYHVLQVKVIAPKGLPALKPFYRRGYYAPSE